MTYNVFGGTLNPAQSINWDLCSPPLIEKKPLPKLLLVFLRLLRRMCKPGCLPKTTEAIKHYLLLQCAKHLLKFLIFS